MPRKINEENERVKREYLVFLRDAKRCDEKTVEKAADYLLRFEANTGFKSFKQFHIEQPRAFKERLAREISPKTGKPLSKATVSSILRAVKAFFQWLAGRPGYKSRISYADAEYFNQNAKDARVAHAERPTPFPTLAQCRHAFANMPEHTAIEFRNKALFAFLMITGARDGAIASLRLGHIDLVEGSAFQDARDVRTKASKTITTYFLPTGEEYRDCFERWVRYLRDERLFGNDDPLFPPSEMGLIDGRFAVTGLRREIYSGAGPLREAIKTAFSTAGLPSFPPHCFRKTLVRWADGHYQSREAFKAFSQNIGHDSVVTTLSAYCPVSLERQAELVKGQS